MYYPSSENKGADQLRGYREADLCLCFRLCKLLVFPWGGSIIVVTNTQTVRAVIISTKHLSHLINLEAVRGRIRTNRQMMITAILVSGTGIYMIVRTYVYGADVFYMANDTDFAMMTIADTLSYFNFAVNFFLYFISGRRFRQDLRAVCTRKRNSSGVPYAISSLQNTQTSYTT